MEGPAWSFKLSFRELTIQQFIEQTAARTPTPGGGAMAAVIGAMGCSMAAMVARFTAGKKRFRNIEAEMVALTESFEATAEELLKAADEDSDVYAEVADAYTMARQTDEEKRHRQQRIQAASRRAIDPPLNAARRTLQALRNLQQLSKEFNTQLASDVVVAAHALRASIHGALAQVEINLISCADEQLIQALVAEVESLRIRADEMQSEIDAAMQQYIAP
jgi:formiminotetrahydrofolate cyclodeaminase